jgi:hypothetical protein
VKGVSPLHGDRTRGLAPFVGAGEASFRTDPATEGVRLPCPPPFDSQGRCSGERLPARSRQAISAFTARKARESNGAPRNPERVRRVEEESRGGHSKCATSTFYAVLTRAFMSA